MAAATPPVGLSAKSELEGLSRLGCKIMCTHRLIQKHHLQDALSAKTCRQMRRIILYKKRTKLTHTAKNGANNTNHNQIQMDAIFMFRATYLAIPE
jgi:hypothetical protein